MIRRPRRSASKVGESAAVTTSDMKAAVQLPPAAAVEVPPPAAVEAPPPAAVQAAVQAPPGAVAAVQAPAAAATAAEPQAAEPAKKDGKPALSEWQKRMLQEADKVREDKARAKNVERAEKAERPAPKKGPQKTSSGLLNGGDPFDPLNGAL
jgi:hypothetical protein